MEPVLESLQLIDFDFAAVECRVTIVPRVLVQRIDPQEIGAVLQLRFIRRVGEAYVAVEGSDCGWLESDRLRLGAGCGRQAGRKGVSGKKIRKRINVECESFICRGALTGRASP